MEYSIKEKKEGEGLNEYDWTIEISGVKTEVTINSLLDHLESTQKVQKEQSGQMTANAEMCRRLEDEYEFLKDLPQDKWEVLNAYSGKKVSDRQAEELIKMCDETIATYTKHLEEIEKATGIKCLPEVSPMQMGVTYKKNGEGTA